MPNAGIGIDRIWGLSLRPTQNVHARSNSSSAAVLIEELRGGACILLRAADTGRLTFGNLAADAITNMLRGSNAELLVGGACFSVDILPEAGSFREAVASWSGVGDLFERIAALERAAAISHVVCLDRWSAELLTNPRTLLQDAKWVLVSNLDEQRLADGAEIREETEIWIQAKQFDAVLPAREFFEFHPGAQTIVPTAVSPALKKRLTGDSASGRLVVIDEAPDVAPAPGAITAASDRWRNDRIVFLSPHLPIYHQVHPKLLDTVGIMAIDTRTLDLSVYQAILQCADLYFAPSGWPFGKLSERALRKPTEVVTILDRESANLSPRAPCGTSTLTTGSSSQDRSESPLEGQDEKTIDGTLETWWKGHAKLRSSISAEETAIDFSILTFCHKYLQRFRIFLDSIARQNHPLERIEVCVVLPGNPDGAAEYLRLFQIAHPRLAVRVRELDGVSFRNRGNMINAAFTLSHGAMVMVADGDIVLPRDFVTRMLREREENAVLGCWRTALSPEITAQIVTGNLDAVEHHEALRTQWDDAQREEVRQGVLGYCQILPRQAFQAVNYPDEFDRINQSDIVFVERLEKRLGLRPKMLKDLFLLHLHHQRNWNGTEVFL